MSSSDLHTKYRSDSLNKIIGQESTVKSLKSLFKEKEIPHAYLFYGPPGTGKTTIARIIAKHLKCEENNLIEIDAAEHTGVNDARELKRSIQYTALGSSGIKFVIIDECHRLSASAFDALLKTVEEPRSHMYFVFCTTEFNKVPAAIASRCHKYALKEVPADQIFELIKEVAEKEEIELADESLKLISRSCLGSPRDALVLLSQCRGCESKADVARLISNQTPESEVIELLRLVAGYTRPNFQDVQRILKGLDNSNAESVRYTVCNYLKKCIYTAKSKEDMMRFGKKLYEFSKPINNGQAFYEIVLNTIMSIW